MCFARNCSVGFDDSFGQTHVVKGKPVPVCFTKSRVARSVLDDVPWGGSFQMVSSFSCSRGDTRAMCFGCELLCEFVC